MSNLISLPGFDALGDLLKPTMHAHTALPPLPPPQMAIHPGGKLLANDLDSSLANLVGSECPAAYALVAERFHKDVYCTKRPMTNAPFTFTGSHLFLTVNHSGSP